MRLKLIVMLAVVGLAGCGGGNKAVECKVHAHCNLGGMSGGSCDLYEMTGNRWCSYSDDECPSGRRWSDFDVGDQLSGTCQAEMSDAGAPDGGVAVNDAALIACEPKILFRRTSIAAGAHSMRTINPDGTGELEIYGTESIISGWSYEGSRVLLYIGGIVRVVDADGSNEVAAIRSSAFFCSGPQPRCESHTL